MSQEWTKKGAVFLVSFSESTTSRSDFYATTKECNPTVSYYSGKSSERKMRLEKKKKLPTNCGVWRGTKDLL